ncbi:MAG: hypothetical protein LIO46_02170 [Clostridiales bacterium]|nr:hypothetical protein [Clostridiales bacterium]
MADYQKMYMKMAHAADDAVALNLEATQKLINARQAAEELFLDADETPMQLVIDDPPVPDETEPE